MEQNRQYLLALGRLAQACDIEHLEAVGVAIAALRFLDEHGDALESALLFAERADPRFRIDREALDRIAGRKATP